MKAEEGIERGEKTGDEGGAGGGGGGGGGRGDSGEARPRSRPRPWKDEVPAKKDATARGFFQRSTAAKVVGAAGHSNR